MKNKHFKTLFNLQVSTWVQNQRLKYSKNDIIINLNIQYNIQNNNIT